MVRDVRLLELVFTPGVRCVWHVFPHVATIDQHYLRERPPSPLWHNSVESICGFSGLSILLHLSVRLCLCEHSINVIFFISGIWRHPSLWTKWIIADLGRGPSTSGACEIVSWRTPKRETIHLVSFISLCHSQMSLSSSPESLKKSDWTQVRAHCKKQLISRHLHTERSLWRELGQG